MESYYRKIEICNNEFIFKNKKKIIKKRQRKLKKIHMGSENMIKLFEVMLYCDV